MDTVHCNVSISSVYSKCWHHYSGHAHSAGISRKTTTHWKSDSRKVLYVYVLRPLFHLNVRFCLQFKFRISTDTGTLAYGLYIQFRCDSNETTKNDDPIHSNIKSLENSLTVFDYALFISLPLYHHIHHQIRGRNHKLDQ